MRTNAGKDLVTDIKEKMSYLALDCGEMEKYKKSDDLERVYELPDGRKINIGKE